MALARPLRSALGGTGDIGGDKMAEERHLLKSRRWGLRAVLPVPPLLSCCSKSLAQTLLPGPRLAARASCPAWKLSTATGLIN